jgi:hypothetical protein
MTCTRNHAWLETCGKRATDVFANTVSQGELFENFKFRKKKISKGGLVHENCNTNIKVRDLISP